MIRTIHGKLDEFGFAYLPVIIAKEKGEETQAKAIIDTGAAHCALKKHLIEKLQLEAVSKSSYTHVQFGEMLFNDYFVNLILDAENPTGCIVVKSVKVTEFNSDDYPCDLLIGVDLLQHARFEYNGLEKNFTMDIRI